MMVKLTFKVQYRSYIYLGGVVTFAAIGTTAALNEAVQLAFLNEARRLRQAVFFTEQKV